MISAFFNVWPPIINQIDNTREAKLLFCNFSSQCNVGDFCGVTFSDLVQIEDFFKLMQMCMNLRK